MITRPVTGVLAAGVALALSTSACTDLGDVDRDRCGNGVVEPGRGEDCDRGDGTCGRPGTVEECRLLCDRVSGTPACPEGGTCGVDGVCHAPSDQLDLTMSGPWTSRHLLVGDASGDTYPELIGVGDNVLDVRQGGGDGTFTQQVLLPNLPLYDVPRTGDVNGDGLTDVLVPVGIGLFSLVGDQLATLQPIFQDSFTMATVGSMIMTSVEYVSGSGSNQVPATELMAAMRLPQGPDCPVPGGCDVVLFGDVGVGLPGGRRIEHVIGNDIPWADLIGGTASDMVAVLAFRDDPATQLVDESGVFTYLGDPILATFTAGAQISGLPGKVKNGAWLADLDRDGRAEVLVSVEGPGGTEQVMVAWARLGGGFDAPVLLIGPGAGAVQGSPLVWADLDQDGADDLVTSRGVWFTSCIIRACVFVSGSGQDRTWAGAVAADLNGDDELDVAAFTSGGVIVDVLLGTGARGFWNEAPLAAPGDVLRMREGDFDGNGVGDLALATAPFGVSGADEIHVAYGRASQPPQPPQFMGFVGSMVAMDVGQAPLPGRQDTIDDLFVASERGSGKRGISIVLGSTSQRMIAPLIPLAGSNSFNLVQSILTVSVDGDPYDDVVCLMSGFSATGGDVASVIRVYTSDAAGTLTERTPAAGVPVPSDEFILGGALWTAIPGQGGRPATIVGADIEGRTVSATISCSGTTCTLSPHAMLLTGLEVGEPTSLHTADLDGDGDLDLVATFRDASGDESSVLIWHRDAAGGFGAAQVLDAPARLNLTDVAAVDLDLDGRASLLLVARGPDAMQPGIYLSQPADGGTYAAPVLDARFDAEHAAQGVTVTARDLTGDGLADVAIVSGTDRTAPRTIAVFTQREELGALAGVAP